MSLDVSDARSAVTLPRAASGGDIERLHREVALDVELARPGRGVPNAERTSALLVSVLTLACTVISLFDLYLLASHAA